MGSTPKAVGRSLNSWNAQYLDEQYARYLQDPATVSEDLRWFFEGFDLARRGETAPSQAAASGPPVLAPTTPASERSGPLVGAKHAAVAELVRQYRTIGHIAAAIDPFGRERPMPAMLSPQAHGLTDADLDTPFEIPGLPFNGPATLRQIVEMLDETYCGSVGVEYMHIEDDAERQWLAERIERTRNRPQLSDDEKRELLKELVDAEAFEKFLHTRYPGEKRFSLEGSESVIPTLHAVIEAGGEEGVEEVVMGMAHRGRLNVLRNILGKTPEQIFTEFEDTWEEDFVEGGGDVKYHRGYSGEYQTHKGKRVWLAMASNPSHLEAVGPVVMGRTRGKQRLRGDTDRTRVIPLLLHGDAAVIGQGVVAETLNFSQLPGYFVGGAIRIVINNLIGFTTSPEYGRTSRYCTDVGKMIQTPVFHVNGEDPEACVHVARIAMEYRQRFRKDIFIDVLSYRRWGHNESDEPSFTQPLLYDLIRKKPSVMKTYAERLLAQGVISEEHMSEVRGEIDAAFDKAQAATKDAPFDPTIDPGSRKWQGFGAAFSFAPVDTAATQEELQEVARALGATPDDFTPHRKLQKLLEARAGAADALDKPIDYATAELLAYGTLLVEGTPIRLSGQDSRRGTFSQRHALLRDTKTGAEYIPLNHIREVCDPSIEVEGRQHDADGVPCQARFCVYDSPLSEEACVAFEYGYALTDPHQLVLWEAQFGDFVNGAQIQIDQFLASAEIKWQRWSGLVLLLPHGYEGQGPEHSSARLERFLQLCGDDNLQVVYPSTAAQIFHLLRRQARRQVRKPLIVMTPKSMLRVETSTVGDLVEGRFQEAIDDPAFTDNDAARKKVSRVILCSGKFFHELRERRDALKRDDVAIIRVEQLYPLHDGLLREILSRYPEGAEIVWSQEEPRNAGAYRFMEAMLRERCGVREVHYIGRSDSATPAVGSKHKHKEQQEAILVGAIGAKPDAGSSPTPAKTEGVVDESPAGEEDADASQRSPAPAAAGKRR
ncbi:MAG: 2-oxoglutarate dehydrogenase E1 component [Phycisphaerales bacterium]